MNMIKKLLGFALLAMFIFASSASAAVHVYFGGTFTGTTWHDTISAPIGANVDVPVYFDFSAEPTAYIGNVHLPLGVNNTYIDAIPLALCSSAFFPFNAWDDASFLGTFEAAPPNQSGYHSRSFLGFADLGGQSNPWLHYTSITQGLKFVIHTINNSAWVGTTVMALRDGVSSTLAGPALGDSVGGPGYVAVTHYAYLLFSANSSQVNAGPSLPTTFGIAQNYPNPFNAQTKIAYSLAKPTDVSIDIFDLLGCNVARFSEGAQEPGNHEIIWDASGVTSGIYFYRLTAGDYRETKRMLLLK
jgi:hypothetical protein